MHCGHTGFHSITSRYDREQGTLVYLRVCERCGTAVSEVERVSYRPRFQAMPHCGYLRDSPATGLEARRGVE